LLVAERLAEVPAQGVAQEDEAGLLR